MRRGLGGTIYDFLHVICIVAVSNVRLGEQNLSQFIVNPALWALLAESLGGTIYTFLHVICIVGVSNVRLGEQNLQ